jgi:hypothetical protein
MVPVAGGFEVYLRDQVQKDVDISKEEPRADLSVHHRFSLAHEIAHTRFYRFSDQVPSPDDMIPNGRKLEDDCDRMAGCILVPTYLLKQKNRDYGKMLCEAWQWRQANGALRDMVCRGLLLMLDRAGQIELPPVSYVRHNPLANRARPEPARIDTTPIESGLRNLQSLEFEPVRRTGKEPLWNSLLEEHHYLGYEQPVGEHLKYLVWAQERPVACLAWSSVPRHLGSRDRYIGWSAEARRRNVRFIAYKTRFLIRG